MRKLKAYWPSLVAVGVFVIVVIFIRPWANLPLNDDWQYAHFAKSLAEKGRFSIDVPVAPTVIGQSIIAWPIIKIFGFSHVSLRLLTIILSAGLLFAVDFLLVAAGVSGIIRLVALCMIVVNPIFLHLSTTFMTENYGYLLAILSACVWFGNRPRNSRFKSIAAALIAGASFWIRQFCALVFPALVIAEWISNGASVRHGWEVLRKHLASIAVWLAIVVVYFPWARATGNYSPQFSDALGRVSAPDPLALFFETGVFLFYMTILLAPFLLAFGLPRRPSVVGSIALGILVLTAAFAWFGGIKSGQPSSLFNKTFPFLNNVMTSYGVGPITLTDVYWENAQRPQLSRIPWVIIEAGALVISLAWSSVWSRLRAGKNEVAMFGVTFAVLSLIAVLFAYRYDVFDRYHYSGILGFTIALAALLPQPGERRLRRAGVVYVGVFAVFSTLGVHDYFRWQESRAQLLGDARQRGISLSQIDAGFELNGWGTVEENAASSDCGPDVVWFCRSRAYRVGLGRRESEELIASRPVSAWLTGFPDVKLLGPK